MLASAPCTQYCLNVHAFRASKTRSCLANIDGAQTWPSLPTAALLAGALAAALRHTSATASAALAVLLARRRLCHTSATASATSPCASMAWKQCRSSSSSRSQRSGHWPRSSGHWLRTSTHGATDGCERNGEEQKLVKHGRNFNTRPKPKTML